MPAPEGERLATMEAELRALREQIAGMSTELHHRAGRLAALEATAHMFLLSQRQNRHRDEVQYRRLELRLQVLAVVVSLAAVVSPLVTIIVLGR